MPRLLLDTHTFLWWVDDAPDLTAAARRAIGDVRNQCCLSMVSCWEMAIKSSLGKLRLSRPVDRFVTEQLAANGFTLLSIELRHAANVEKMPFHHRDPFDRLIVAQAMADKLTIVSADNILCKYGAKVLW